MNYYNNFQSLPFLNQNPPFPQLIGKIVDGIEMVKATEVPIGRYGVFPKADLGEVYIKMWNNNGTTSITTFIPSITNEINKEDKIEQLITQINILQTKIDSLGGKEESKANEY